jgi:uncharacterized membrane protein SpoIIM required for sporulation
MSEKSKKLIRYIVFFPAAILTWVLALFILSFLFKRQGDLIDEIAFWSSRVLGAPGVSIMVGVSIFPQDKKVIPIILLSLFWISFTIFSFMVYKGFVTPFD